MSNINFTCPHCQSQMNFPLSSVGQQGKCGSCQQIVMIEPSPPVATPQPPAKKNMIIFGCAGCAALVALVVLALILVPTLIGIFTYTSSTKLPEEVFPPFEMHDQSSDVVSMAEYSQIDNEMSYAQVVSIIGTSGTESSTSTMKGVPGGGPSITTTIYIWQNSDGSNMNAMFQNDKLITKAQAGLK